MSRSPRAPRRALLAGFLLTLSTLAVAPFAPPADAHGSTQEPASRAYVCRFNQPDNPMCAAAWSANSQALYDWMEVNIGDAAGRHRQLIPDGQLCSAGRAKYGALDRPGAWPVTALRADGSGLVDLVYENTAPHSTEYYRVYITGSGFDARTDALAWGDLQLVYDSGPLERSARQVMRAPIPERTVPAILYIVWQRSDSPEAFYACSDVTVSNGSPGTTAPPTTTLPPTTLPTTTVTTAPSTTRATTPATTASTTRPTAPPTTTSRPTVAPSSNPATTARPSVPPSSVTRPTSSAPASSQAATGSNPSVVVVATAPADQQGSSSLAADTEPADAGSTNDGSTSTDSSSDESLGAAGSGTAPPSSASPQAANLDQAGNDLETDSDEAGTATSADATEAAAGPVEAGSPSGGGWLLVGAAVGLGSLGLVLLGFGLGTPDWRRRGVELLRGLGDGPPVLGVPPSRPAPPTDHYDVRHVGQRP